MSRLYELVCEDTRARLTRLLQGELASEERERVERHLEKCPACTSELRATERALAGLRGLPASESDRLRDEALRELGVPPDEEAPLLPSRRARIARILLTLVLIGLVALALRARHESRTDAPRGVETR